VKSDLSKRPEGWLHAATKAIVHATTEDWHAWRAS
jgi:hypothetical protein